MTALKTNLLESCKAQSKKCLWVGFTQRYQRIRSRKLRLTEHAADSHHRLQNGVGEASSQSQGDATGEVNSQGLVLGHEEQLGVSMDAVLLQSPGCPQQPHLLLLPPQCMVWPITLDLCRGQTPNSLFCVRSCMLLCGNLPFLLLYQSVDSCLLFIWNCQRRWKSFLSLATKIQSQSNLRVFSTSFRITPPTWRSEATLMVTGGESGPRSSTVTDRSHAAILAKREREHVGEKKRGRIEGK